MIFDLTHSSDEEEESDREERGGGIDYDAEDLWTSAILPNTSKG